MSTPKLEFVRITYHGYEAPFFRDPKVFVRFKAEGKRPLGGMIKPESEDPADVRAALKQAIAALWKTFAQEYGLEDEPLFAEVPTKKLEEVDDV